jgi:hypothetical protein
MLLSKDCQSKAREFIHCNARPLERSLYAWHFEDGEKEDVLRELGEFQNTDGGFGRALEPDLRFSGSSVAATTWALQILREVSTDRRPDQAEAAIAYLLDVYDHKIESWMFLPKEANTAPHAPWWGYKEYPPKRWDDCLDNPRPGIVGYLHEYSDLVPATLLERLTHATVARLNSVTGSMAKDDVQCYVCFLETQALPVQLREQILPKLQEIVKQSVTKEPEKWSGYCLKPLDVVSAPDSFMADALSEQVELNLNYEIEHQHEDGSWIPNWSWGDSYPDVWRQAEREWKGILTLLRLKQLQAFGRLE